MPRTKITERNNHWVLQVEDENGKYKQIFKHKLKSKVNHKRSEVQASAINVKAEIDRRTFVSVYEEFANHKIKIASHPKSGMRLKSVKHYLAHYKNYIKPNFDSSVLLKNVNPALMDNLFLKLRALGCSWILCKNVLDTFHGCYKYAIEEQYIDAVSAGHVLIYKVRSRPSLKPQDESETKSKKTVMASLEECKSIIKYFYPGDHNLDPQKWLRFSSISALVFCGFRLSELRGWTWSSIDFNTQKFAVDHTVVGSEFKKQTKADGSHRLNKLHPVLFEILKKWKKIQMQHFYPRASKFVFPSLRNVGSVVPIADRTLTDWLNKCYHDLGYAEIEIQKNKTGDTILRTKVLWSKFKGCPTKTFRHFASTSLLNAQASNPTLDDNFIKNYIGHQQIKTTREIYGDHNNLNTTNEHEQQQQDSLAKAIPITYN